MQEKRRELIDVLTDESILIADSKIGKMLNLLSLTPEQEEELMQFFLDINIPDDVTKTLIDTLLLRFELSKFYEYTKNRNIRIDDHLGKVLDMGTMFDFSSLVSWLMKLVWKTQPPSGEGEAAIAMMFQDGRKPNTYEAGDVIIGDRTVEVKGKGARIIGQRGYGDGPSVGMNMQLQFQRLAKKHGVQVHIPTDPLCFNFSKKGEWVAETIGQELIRGSDGCVTSSDIINIVVQSLLLLYKDASSDEIEQWVKPCVNIVGTFSKEEFIRKFLVFSFQYYHRIEKFQLFVLVNDDRLLAIDPKDFELHLDKYTFGMPSFGHKAGTQGKAFSIKLK